MAMALCKGLEQAELMDIKGSSLNSRAPAGLCDSRNEPTEWGRWISFTVMGVFWLGVLRHIELPGLYMDAINPDYLAAHTLNGALDNPVWVLPTAFFPILGNLYHGVQNYYLGLPIYKLLGTNVVSARISQAMFGAVIVWLSYLLALRATGSRLLSLVAAAGLATDVAFLSSFRTQNNIILGGEAWLFAGLFLLLNSHASTLQRRRRAYFCAAVCFGLAVYGYFVFLFFFPAVALLISRAAGGDRKEIIKISIAGIAVGMLPYVLGYISLAVALKGIIPTFHYIASAASNLDPFSSHLTIVGGFQYALGMARVAMSNTGNELMIFGEPLGGIWTDIRLTIIVVIIFIGLLFLFLPSVTVTRKLSLGIFLVLLPCSYMVFCGLLGKRLWAHHFSVLIPFAYLLCGVILHDMYLFISRTISEIAGLAFKSSVAMAGIALVFGNLWQQNLFFSRLAETGGVGKASSALTMMAEDALSSKKESYFVFPEWGFFMSFAFLTGNQVPYALQFMPEDISAQGKLGRQIRVPFWDLKDIEKYVAILKGAGVGTTELRPFFQRDGKIAFYLLVGEFAG